MNSEAKWFRAPLAWVGGAWAREVLLGVSAQGLWSHVEPEGSVEPAQAVVRLDGPVLPGVVNAHSHAFQRAIAGLTEQRSVNADNADDDFWSWRTRMYTAANCITPEQLEIIACQLYAELLAGGYTHVCEFHYLHHALNGVPYAREEEMALALLRAAQSTGIGLTLLPTLYMRAGFAQASLRSDQRRFAGNPDLLVRLVESLQRACAADLRLRVGVALHSLRAVAPGALKELAAYAAARALPVHIHVAEQTQEVDDCLVHTGLRPIEWLLEHVPMDAHWSLVHATHTTPEELLGVQVRGAGIVVCPSTEANLGDGVLDFSRFVRLGGRWSIGSDSHVTRRASEELRLLEYSQRLTQRKRNIAAQLAGSDSTAAALLQGALGGGSAAAGAPLAGLHAGQRADFVVLDADAAALLGVARARLLDALVFSSPDAPILASYVAGTRTRTAHHPRFAATLRALWGG